jgi:hypothetical protein
MRISVLIFISLAANLALAALLFRTGHGSTAASGDVAAEVSSGVTDATDNSSATPNDRFVTTAAGAKISWRDLQAAELKEFVRKLRAVNCPEETIKDLVLADLNRRYSKQQRSLWSDQQNQDYWKPYQRKVDPAEQKKNRDRSKQMQALQKEKKALIVELFGVDVEKQRMKEEGYDTDNMGWNPSGNLSFLPEAKRDAVQKYLDDFNDKEQDFYASVSGSWDADARAKQKKLEQEKLDGLAQFLTPDELREYKLRNSQMASQISSDLHGVDLSREQYEALFDIRSKYGDSIYNYGDAGNDADTIKQIEQNKKDMQAEIAAALGTDKSAELERAQDYQYQQLASLARHNDLPADTAPKIYDFKQAAEKAAAAVKASPDLSPEERQAALAQIRTETEASVKTALGDKLYKRYTSNGGWWLNNIAPSTSQRLNSVIVH